MSPENGSKSDTEANFDPENDSIISFGQFEHFETEIELDQVFFFSLESNSSITNQCPSGIKKNLNSLFSTFILPFATSKLFSLYCCILNFSYVNSLTAGKTSGQQSKWTLWLWPSSDMLPCHHPYHYLHGLHHDQCFHSDGVCQKTNSENNNQQVKFRI